MVISFWHKLRCTIEKPRLAAVGNAGVAITRPASAVLLVTARTFLLTLMECANRAGSDKSGKRKKQIRQFANTAEGSSERKMA